MKERQPQPTLKRRGGFPAKRSEKNIGLFWASFVFHRCDSFDRELCSFFKGVFVQKLNNTLTLSPLECKYKSIAHFQYHGPVLLTSSKFFCCCFF